MIRFTTECMLVQQLMDNLCTCIGQILAELHIPDTQLVEVLLQSRPSYKLTQSPCQQYTLIVRGSEARNCSMGPQLLLCSSFSIQIKV